MTIKRIILLATLLAMWQGTFAQEAHFTANGTEQGTKEKPFLIKSIEDLNYLAEDIANGVPKDGDGFPMGYKGKYFKLTADLDYSGVALNEKGSNFKPIGFGDESDAPNHHFFAGFFDGDNHTIKGITVNNPEGYGIGLFGYIYMPAVIKNIKLENCSFTGNFEVGAIVGVNAIDFNSHIVGGGGGSSSSDTEKHGIYNCQVASNVTVKGVEATIEGETLNSAFIGGIIGSSNSITVSNCISAAKVEGYDCVGGITGRLKSTNDKELGIIEDCYYTGENSVSGTNNYGIIAGAYGPVTDYDGSEGTKGLLAITLFDDDTHEAIKNATRIENYSGQTPNLTIKGRTLYKDNKWNTICLPFSIDNLNGTALEGATVKTLETTTFTNGTLTLNFSKESKTAIEAGKPYAVKWESGSAIENPTFNSVSLSSETTSVETDHITFQPLFAPVGLTTNDKQTLYMGGNNKLYYPTSAFNINAFRALFKLKGLTVGTIVSPTTASRFMLNFDGEEEVATGISSVSCDGIATDNNGWYSIDGRRLSSKPTQRGIYLNNGKKIVVK